VIVGKPIHLVPGELRCPRCFGKDIVLSRPRAWRDAVMRAFGRTPRHCRCCACRFYVRRPTACAAAPEELLPTEGQALPNGRGSDRSRDR